MPPLQIGIAGPTFAYYNSAPVQGALPTNCSIGLLLITVVDRTSSHNESMTTTLCSQFEWIALFQPELCSGLPKRHSWCTPERFNASSKQNMQNVRTDICSSFSAKNASASTERATARERNSVCCKCGICMIGVDNCTSTRDKFG